MNFINTNEIEKKYFFSIKNIFLRKLICDEDSFPEATLGNDFKKGNNIFLPEGEKILIWLTTTGLLNANWIKSSGDSTSIFGFMKVKDYEVIGNGILFQSKKRQYYVFFHVREDCTYACKFIGLIPNDIHIADCLKNLYPKGGNINFAIC